MKIKLYILWLFLLIANIYSQKMIEIERGKIEILKFDYDPELNDSRLIGLKISLEEGWHLYWTNPGDAGIPTNISFEAKEKIKIKNIYFPVPKHFVSEGMISFGFEGSFLIMLELEAVEKKIKAIGKIKIDGLVCKDICQPFEAVIEDTINFVEKYQTGEDLRAEYLNFFSNRQKKINKIFEYKINEDKIIFDAEIKEIKDYDIKTIYYYPFENGIISNPAKYNFEFKDGKINFAAKLNPYLTKEIDIISGILKIEFNKNNDISIKSYELNFSKSK